jgi:tetratricopeptide (TPR) repeat protein
MGFGAVYAQQGADGADRARQQANERLGHKIKMVDFMLNSPALIERMNNRSQSFLEMDEYFDRGQFLEAEAIIDYVLRDLSVASQLLSAASRAKNRYGKTLEKLDSFSLPEWTDLTLEQSEYLQTSLEQIRQRREQAVELARAEKFEPASQMLNEAYDLKTQLITELEHEKTVVYDLVFESIQEEYDYLNKRSYHYLEMVELALEQRDVKVQTRKLIDDFIYRSVVNIEAAENLQSEARFDEAIAALDKSIKHLTSVLKILGITI